MPVPDEFDGDITRTIAPGSASGALTNELKAWKQFRLIERVGAGGFGEVYRAFDTQLHREVALKLLYRPDDAGNESYSETLREARALARVRHANVVPVYGVDRDDSRIGLWSEFIQGRNLASLLQAQGAMSQR